MWRLVKRYNLETFRRPLDRRAYLRRADVERLHRTFEPRSKSDEGKEAA